MLHLLSFFAVFFWFLSSHAILLNSTIDDTTGDPLTGTSVIYIPPDAWTDSETVTCTRNCPPGIPNVENLGGRTFHNSTFSPNSGSYPNVPLTASVSFNGSAVYVFCALSRAPDGNSDMTFFLDGVVVGHFIQPPIGSAGFEYTVPVYANPSIPSGPHTLTIQNGQQDGSPSLMILDSIVYSYEAEEDDSSPSFPTAAQAAGPSGSSTPSTRHGPSGTTLAVVGVLVFAVVVLLIVLGVLLFRRRRRRRAIYAEYMPRGAVRAFPPELTPSPSPSMSPVLSPLPPAYAGGSRAPPDWWVGRDQKNRDGPRALHRPFVDLDPSQAGIQRPQGWERKTSYQY